MNENYSSIEPVTDLGLGSSYSDYIQERLANKSGVGANAGSMADVKYVATDSLSELVWSPKKGLSVRCANSTFKDQKNSIVCDVAPTAEKPTSNKLHEDIIIIPSKPEIHVKNLSESKDNLNRTVYGDAGPVTSEVKMLAPEKGNAGDAKETDSSEETLKDDRQESRAGKIPVDDVPEIRQNNCSSSPVHTNKINEASKKQDKPELEKVQCELLITNTVDEGRHEDFGNLTAGKDTLHPALLEKLEFSAENDLQIMKEETGGCEGSKIIVTESANEVRGSNQQDERNNYNHTADSASPENSKSLWKQRKGKEKALSDGDVHARISNNEDTSCGSVESCSGAIFANRKRRWSFEQQLIVLSKRMKQEDYASGPASNSGQDSSFRSWMSNMMKGFSHCIQNEAPSLDLTLAKPEFKKNCDPDLKSFGFKSMFRSLYGPIARGEEVEEPINANCQMEQVAKEIETVNKIYDLNATPISCYRESDNLSKQLLLTNENVEFTSENGVNPLIQPKTSSEFSSCGSHRSRKTRSREKGNSCDLVISKKKSEVRSNDASKSKSIGNCDRDLPSLKTNYNFGNTGYPFKSLWIARFAPKTSGLMPNPESSNQNAKDVDVHHSMEDLDTAVSKEQCYITANAESSPGHDEFKSHNEQKSIIKLNPVLSFPAIRSSEAIAPVFARRLGAFKQQSEFSVSSADGCDSGEMELNSGIGLNAKPENRKFERVDPNSKNDVKLDDEVSEVGFVAESVPKCVIPKFSEKSLKESEMGNVDRLPQGVFNAVKNLQLTRNDVLKCMKSQMSLSRLDGFFMRIRLGKWEGGLKGTRYHVACISGAQLAKNYISVVVQGIDCQVQSQYISNHGFLEDELAAWWCATSKNGGKMISLAADLRAKVKKKKQLGF